MPITISGSTGIAGVDGSASTPAVQGTDTNTGIFFPAADTIAFGEGGSEAMRIDSSGNVGIGTSSPSQKLEVNGQGLFKTGTNDLIRVLSDSGAMEIVRASGDAYIDLKSTDAEDWDVRLQSVGTGGTFSILTNGAERARINSSGNFLVGTTSTFDVTSGATTQLYGQCAVYNTGSPNTLMSFYNSSQSARVGFIGSNGNSTQYNSGSDYRLKDDVTNISQALTTISNLRPVTFKWKVSHDLGLFSGFIAHELQDVWPEAVSGEKDAMCSDGVTPDYQAVDQSKLVPLLVAAIQELKADNDAMKERIAALEAK
jgi:hypothetical protein